MLADENECADTWCWASSAVGDAWVTLSAYGGADLATDPSGWQSLVDAVIGAVAEAGVG